MDDKRMECILRSLFTELLNHELWALSWKLSSQLGEKPLFQVFHDHLPDVDHRDAAEKIAAAVNAMYQELEQQDTGEALSLAAARYILCEDERETPYALGLSSVELVEIRNLLVEYQRGSLSRSEVLSAYEPIFRRKIALSFDESIDALIQRLSNID